jgi:hypothetical protein
MAALHHDTSPAKDIFAYRPDLDRALGTAVMNAMKPNVNDRTEDMESFLRQIKGCKSEFAV